MGFSDRKWNWTLIRNIAAFWIFGLCNNYGYVIMLSAAEDILNIQKNKTRDTSGDTCEDIITSRHCSMVSTGAVLLADTFPSLCVKLTFPLFMHRIPFQARVFTVCLLQATAYFVVAFSTTIAMSLSGVVITSIGAGLGEITFLALTAHYPKYAIAGWSSGTGGAGLLGSFSYAFLTEPHMGNLSPKVALLIQLFIPVLFFAAFFLLLVIPETVYRPSWKPETWLVPKNYDDFLLQLNMKEGSPIVHKVPQRELTLTEKIKLLWPLLHLMIPLSIAYMGEYLINQGTTELIFFRCGRAFGLSRNSQYRWYQVLCQFGGFLSRSSIRLIELPTPVLYLLPVLQLLNMTFFILEAVYWFVPHIAIIFALIIFEGLFAGFAYVNTLHKIHRSVAPDVREYSLSASSMGDSIGVNIAAFLAIPIHNGVCHRPMPHH